jgi:nicotinamide-nucleotide amidase
MERGERLVVLLPGVPREMKAIYQGELRALLSRRLGDRLLPLHHRTLQTTGIAESELAGRVEALLPEELGPLSIAFLPELTGVDLRLTARGVPAVEAERWFRVVEEALSPVLDEFGFLAASGDLVEAVGRRLRQGGRRLAVAESCTGGLVARRLTEPAGSSDYFLGGVVAYANEAKVRTLGVDPEVLERAGAVSEEVVGQMARGVAQALGGEAALAVTGIAGPGGGSPGKPVGTVWYAALVDDDLVARREVFVGDRSAVRERSAQAVLALLLRKLEGKA